MRLRISHFVVALLLSACGGGNSVEGVADPNTKSQTALTQVVLQTDWYAQPEHAGFYQAQLEGLYEAQGLDVEIRPGANMTNVPQMVATGRIEFAVGTTDNMLMAASRGVPLMALFPYFQHDPQCVMFHADNDIHTLADLNGRTVMINPGAAYVQYLQKALGIRLQLVPLDYSLARFLADPKFIQQCFVTSEPYYVEKEGVSARVLLLSGSGFDPYRVVYTNAEFAKQNPELVRAFTHASLQGWARYMASDGKVVHERLLQLNPQQTLDFAAWTKAAIAENQLVFGDAAAGERFGVFNRHRLEQHLQQLEQIDLLDKVPDLDATFFFQASGEHEANTDVILPQGR